MSDWEGDLLGRNETATFLEKVIWRETERRIENPSGVGFVVALDAEWGAGKTFFIEHWAAQLRRNHVVISFDAWRNDFDNDPLLAIIAEILRQLRPLLSNNSKARSAVNKFKKSASRAIKPAAIIGASAVTKMLLGMSVERVVDVLRQGGDANGATENDGSQMQKHADVNVEQVFQALIKEHEDRKSAIEEMRSALERMVVDVTNSKHLYLPLYVLVDEVDRCRPLFGLQLLEGTKHLFGVKGVCFVFATNLRQLSAATKAVYGGEFDARGYLKRFFDLRYELPKPNHRQFVQQVLQETGVLGDKRLLSCLDSEAYFQIQQDNDEQIVEVFLSCSKAFDLQLRDQQNAATIINAALSAIQGEKVFAAYLFFLVMLHVKSPDRFEKLVSPKLRKDGDTLNAICREVAETPSTVKTVRYVEGRTREENVPILDVCRALHRCSYRSLSDLTREINQTQARLTYPNSLIQLVVTAAPASFPRRPSGQCALSSYASAVRHAGSISADDSDLPG